MNPIGKPQTGQAADDTIVTNCHSSSFPLVDAVKLRLTEVVPALRYDTEHHRSEGEALIAQVSRFITDTGDGGFAVALFHALELLPEVSAHYENLAETDSLFQDGRIDLPSDGQMQKVFKSIAHMLPDLRRQLAGNGKHHGN